jgi:hypothetical protein
VVGADRRLATLGCLYPLPILVVQMVEGQVSIIGCHSGGIPKCQEIGFNHLAEREIFSCFNQAILLKSNMNWLY